MIVCQLLIKISSMDAEMAYPNHAERTSTPPEQDGEEESRRAKAALEDTMGSISDLATWKRWLYALGGDLGRMKKNS
jgi:hypothetical protein